MPNENSKASDKDIDPEEKQHVRGRGFEIFKILLDFTSKALYPAIIVIIILIITPAIKNIDIELLLKRIQSLKAGGYEVTFAQAEEVAAEGAQSLAGDL